MYSCSVARHNFMRLPHEDHCPPPASILTDYSVHTLTENSVLHCQRYVFLPMRRKMGFLSPPYQIHAFAEHVSVFYTTHICPAPEEKSHTTVSIQWIRPLRSVVPTQQCHHERQCGIIPRPWVLALFCYYLVSRRR